MPTAIKYIFLGIIQGLTEFFPVSSSAHLVIFQQVLQIRENQIFLDIVLHLGTLFALIVFLLKDIKLLLNKKILFYIILVSAFTALVVLPKQSFFEGMFSSARRLWLPLLITSVILLCTKGFTQGRRGLADLKMLDAVWLGIVQGLAVIPGLSRSGLTISTLLFRDVEKETAFKFSFLASIPAILGALFLKAHDFSYLNLAEFKFILWGFWAAFFSGLLALRILYMVMRNAKLHLFGYYCLALTAVLLWIL